MKRLFALLTLTFLMFIAFDSNAQMGSNATSQGKNVPIAEHYEGGQTAMYEFINSKLIYPPNAKRNRIQGECIVSVTLKADGRIADMKLVKNIGAGCGEEAMRIVQLLKFRAPGYDKQYTIPVYFKL